MTHNPSQVKERFAQEGVSIAEWARARGFNCVTVYRVLSGKLKGARGEAHDIAVALGLKERPATELFRKDIAA
jgi:gp16 family phage-associated protein